MTSGALWGAVVAASLACFVLKMAGYLVPAAWLANPRLQRILTLLPLCLLASLTAVQTVGDGQGLAIDARLPALAAAALVLWWRRSFLLAVIAGALVAALLRAAGVML